MADRYDAPTVQMSDMQARVWSYMRNFLQDNDQLPPAEQVARHFGWASRNAADTHIQALLRKGFLERNAVGKLRFSRQHPGYPKTQWVKP